MLALAVGNPFDGLRFWGPFDDAEEADDWIIQNIDKDEEWWLVELGDPALEVRYPSVSLPE